MRWWLLVVVAMGCGPKDWRQAVREDSSAAYRAYARQNPLSFRSEIALRRAENRSWDEALSSNLSADYRGYATAFPDGDHVAEAWAKADELAWAEARSADTISAYESFAELYPQSAHHAEALGLVEDQWYAETARMGSEPAFAAYLERYPTGRYSAAAQAERDRLVWAEVSTTATRSAHQRYLKEFPNGAHVTESRAFVDSTFVHNVRPVLALVGTWQNDASRRKILERLRAGFDRAMVPALAERFRLLPAEIVDAGRGLPHPHETYGTEPDIGVLMIEWTESLGREFEPEGRATDVRAVVRFYVPSTPNPVLVRQIQTTTPNKVRGGPELATLHQAAVDAFYDELRGYASELKAQAPKEAP